MNSPRTTPPTPLAPRAASSYGTAWAHGRHDPLPPVDARLAVPETDTEVVDGVVMETMGANPPHAIQHAEVSHLFRGCLAVGYSAAVDMLTRVDQTNDRAADVSVFPDGPDETTGGRKLEEIAFEVCDTQRPGNVTTMAGKFVARGVLRVFYVQVDEGIVHEWSRDEDDWVTLGVDDVIRDRCFVVPIPVRALLQRVLADDTVAEALIARGNPVVNAAIERARDAARKAGHRQGRKAGRDEGLKAGRDEGLQPLAHPFARRLGRALTAAEFERLRDRLGTLGAARLGDVVLDLDRDALAAWLTDDAAR